MAPPCPLHTALPCAPPLRPAGSPARCIRRGAGLGGVRASAASTSVSTLVQREATVGVLWGCETESLEGSASLERWLAASRLPEQRLFIQWVDISEWGLIALKNICKGEKLLFVPPSLVISADSGVLGHSSTGLLSMNSMKQENENLEKTLSDVIGKCQPDVILVEKAVSQNVNEYIQKQKVTVVSDMNIHRLERIARCTGSPMLSLQNVLAKPDIIKQCEPLHFEKIVEEHNTTVEGGRRSAKTLLFLEGFPKPLGCTAFISYGKKSSGELWLSYRFVPKEGTNSNDSVEMLVSLNRSDKCYEEKVQVLKKSQCSSLIVMAVAELPPEFPDGTTPVTCRVCIYDCSTNSKVGVGSLMDKAVVPALPTGSLYMEEVHAKMQWSDLFPDSASLPGCVDCVGSSVWHPPEAAECHRLRSLTPCPSGCSRQTWVLHQEKSFVKDGGEIVPEKYIASEEGAMDAVLFYKWFSELESAMKSEVLPEFLQVEAFAKFSKAIGKLLCAVLYYYDYDVTVKTETAELCSSFLVAGDRSPS
ncbi:hypothetical protein ABZP36_017549 [Zizania latifolia]